MTDSQTQPQIQSQVASDGYPIHVAVWPAEGEMKGRLVILHGVQSHGGWYHGLGRRLAARGYETHFPDRRGSGANRKDRGHAPSSGRLLRDLHEWLAAVKAQEPRAPLGLAGISWGGKLAVIAAAERPDLVDALALICPGLTPRVGVSLREKFEIAFAWFFNRRKTFPIPLSDPALFTDNPEGQAFIAADRLSLHAGSAGLMAASFVIDSRLARLPGRVHQPTLLILGGRDRIVDNARTRAYFNRIASRHKDVVEYPEGNHTPEFDPDPSRYANDLADWFDRSLAPALAARPGA